LTGPPIYFFVPLSRIGEIATGIFFGLLIVDFLRRERYPALKRWIAETEYGPNNGKDPSGNEELPPPTPTWRRIFRILGRIFSYRIFAKCQSLPFAERLYLGAFAVMFLGFVSSGISGNISYFRGTTLLGCIACSLGFLLWIFPWLQKIWHTSFGKLAITFLNGSVLLVDIIFARLLVADALGLPPQDFDLTVAVCAWIFYIPVWLIVVVILGFFVCIIFLVHIFLIWLVDMLVHLVEIIFLPISAFLFSLLLLFIHLRLIYLLITHFSIKEIFPTDRSTIPCWSQSFPFF
jgi:hypothetical protein